MEMPIQLFEPCDDGKLIGPCRFSWSPTKDGKSSLCLWTHPTISKTLLDHIVRLLDLKKNDGNKEEAPKFQSYAWYKLYSMKILTEIYENEEFQVNF